VWIPSPCYALSLSKASVPKVISVNSLMTSPWRENVRREACMWTAEMKIWRKASAIGLSWGYTFCMVLSTFEKKDLLACFNKFSFGFWNWPKWNYCFLFYFFFKGSDILMQLISKRFGCPYVNSFVNLSMQTRWIIGTKRNSRRLWTRSMERLKRRKLRHKL